ncbi:MAG TPA: S53 family peptidase, partial [Thermoplasmata archaeon]|nr:S53 family peptidase [Thermoplasmata archaeon]
MARTSFALAAALPAILAVALLLLPGSAVATRPNSGTFASLPRPASPGASEIPSPLLAPLAERMGYDASLASGVSVSPPAGGNLTVVLTLWPSSPTFFLPPGPGTPVYTTAEVASEYGLSPTQYGSLESYFVAEGLRITHAWPDRMFLTVEGPASSVGTAFGTSERAGLLGARPVVFPASVPHLPAPFASEVAAVSGLTSSLAPFTLPYETAPNPSVPLSTDSQPAQGQTTTQLTASAAHLIYGMDALYNYSGSAHWATNVGIVLLLWGDGYAPNDVDQFFSTAYPSEFPAPTLRYYPVDGAPAPAQTALQDPSTGPQELTLDIEWAGSAAPGATLDAVYAPDGPVSNNYSPTDPAMEDALNTAVSNVPGAKVISMSFGTVDGADVSFQSAFTTAFHEAQLKGMTLLAASGDNGGTSAKGCQGNVAPQFPATSPDVVSVGGTAPVLSVNALGTVTGLDSEPAWNLSGGGYSTSYAAPSWQLVGSAAAPIQASGMRGEPDVAGPASDNVFFFGGRTAYGEGTSFASPMWAGLIAEMDALRGNSLGFVTPHLYSVGAAERGSGDGGLVAITQGGNCLGSAAAGWDTITGWGSPRALPLFESIA